VRPGLTLLTVGFVALAAGTELGCRASNPPPPRVPVPAQGNTDGGRRSDPVKPLPPPPEYAEVDLGPGFDDVPLVNQRPPEQKAFVQAYQHVGRPRITVFVNRTLEGQLIPVDPGGTRPGRDAGDVFARNANNGTDTRASYDVYLEPGQYDEVEARALDYEAMETILTDWLAANGQVAIVSPAMARQRLTDEQIRDLQSGRPQVARDMAKQLGTEVLVQVQARPTRQTPNGLHVRLIAEAFNIEGGDSIGRAVVDVPPPLEKRTLNKYTRYIARKLMDDMTYAWSTAGPAPQQDRNRANGARPEEQRAPAPQAPAPAPQSPAPAPETAPAPTQESAPAPTEESAPQATPPSQ
jgi:hypothetical protein